MQPHQYWQTLAPPLSHDISEGATFREAYPAVLPDGRQLLLPIRVLPGDGRSAVASLIVNQASFEVEDALSEAMSDIARRLDPDIIVGVPTLGLPLANGVARRLGHTRMVALGTSRKFWYEEQLSRPMRSITSPGQEKRLYIDPRMLPVLEGRRVVVVDDVVSTGTSIAAVLALLAAARADVVGVVAAMLQSRRFEEMLTRADLAIVPPVEGAISSPLLRSTPEGWVRDAAG
ncbi:phosphoribosyltransferase [Chelativorans sp. ZYF759]|uniref:phosphoribosyltransferase n=1 Tax=Chelativorans sp. ZYF759 TaxID=2692213 RepID=UPI00145CAEF1|nr:phosphoribosyltransferase [Chelativorans sp. ZYF759]NMG39645.1 phosphoribosyltransferase [Chelativorans sp. ZYF759]